MKIRPNLLDINWNDLKYFLALHRYERLSVAAKKLGCTHVTIANRIEQLETTMETKLFIKSNKGYHVTKAGEHLLPYAEKCERALRLAQEDYRNDQNMRSKIRIGVTEGFSNYFLSTELPQWVKDKDIDIELISLAGFTVMTSGEVDISITIGPQKGVNIIQRKLTDYTLALFAHRDYVAQGQPINQRTDLANHPFVGYIEDQLFSPLLKYQNDIASNLQVVFKTTTIHTQCRAIKTGIGIGVLPHFVAYGDGDLAAVLPEFVIHREMWISTSKDLHQFKDLKATWDFIIERCAKKRLVFVPSQYDQ